MHALLICFLILFYSALSSAKVCTEQRIFLDPPQKYLLLIRNAQQQVIYQGAFATAHALPLGTHYYFDDAGQFKQVIEYSHSMNDHFEGVPIIIQKAYLFDEKQQLERVTEASRCNECDYEAIGTWHWYKDDKLIKSIDARQLTSMQIELLDDIYWQFQQCK